MMKWLKDRLIKREYIKVTFDGAACTMPPVEACDHLKDADDPKVYRVESVWMTPYQFGAMPEFMGW